MIKKTDYIYVGLDIHKATHTAVLMTYMEERIGQIEIENNIKGFRRLYAYVEKMKKDFIPMFGLEDVCHYGRNLAIYLLEKGHVVKEVNSAFSYMERMSFPTTSKNDDWDAQCVCAVLMRRYGVLPDANPQDYYWTMKQLVNRRDALVKMRSSLLQQLHDQLADHYPSYKKLFSEIDCQTSLAFYEEYPSPKHLENVSIEELGEFLRVPSHNSCSTRKAGIILDIVESDEVKEREYQFSRDFIVQSMVRNIRFQTEELKRLDEVEKKMLNELGYHLETLTGVNTVTACALIAHIGDIKRFQDSRKLANYAGVAPVRYSSAGKGKYVQNKSQGNRELYSTLYLLAMQQICVSSKGIPRNPVFLAYFETKVSEGKTKIQALICIMRRLVTIIFGMMKYKSVYQLPRVEADREKVEQGA